MTQGFRTTCPHCHKDLGPIKGEVELPSVWKLLLAQEGLEGSPPAPHDVRVDDRAAYRDDSRSLDGEFLDDGCTAYLTLSSGNSNYWLEFYIEDDGRSVYESDALFIEDLEQGVIKFESHDVEYEITVKWV